MQYAIGFHRKSMNVMFVIFIGTVVPAVFRAYARAVFPGAVPAKGADVRVVPGNLFRGFP